MDSVPPPPPWNSDDDFLLKNAIETGASLESLAKGVVSFSRWYSLRELRERWRSVLYDSDVSDEASAAMKNLELAKSNGNGTKEVAAPKRKTQTIRKVVIALPSPVNTHPTEEEDKSLPEIEEKLICIDQEKGDAHGDYDSDSDEEHEVPYYSDAEGMILEMDLVPTVQDTNASTEVIRYQSDETKKTIMRLEQCAQSFVQRAIASRGALAVFYGRTLKKYIEKSEVIIGRSTADADVDIDLARAAKDAHKISRRQASIRMDANGSFIIKNLGKRTLYLNGKEVPKGQMRSLSAGSLIEIWGLAFIFDVNKKCVERFIGNVNEQNRIKE